MTSFPDFLRARLRQPLPGLASQLKMAPRPQGQRYPPQQFEPPPAARSGAVLALLYADSQNSLQIILTLRTQLLKHHGGQLSFPGGGIEAGETPLQAALREANEEIGLHPQDVDLLGTLSRLYIPPSNNLVHPHIGLLHSRPEFVPQPEEVEEIVDVPLDHLLDPKNLKEMQQIHRGVNTVIPFWDVFRVPLWGATSMMLRELVDVWEEHNQAL